MDGSAVNSGTYGKGGKTLPFPFTIYYTIRGETGTTLSREVDAVGYAIEAILLVGIVVNLATIRVLQQARNH
ncbi:MAG: hypothetical protein ACYCYO_01420 [Bacilli bacterium]